MFNNVPKFFCNGGGEKRHPPDLNDKENISKKSNPSKNN